MSWRSKADVALILTITAFLLLCAECGWGQERVYLDWSNDITHEMSIEEIESRQGYGMYIWSARALWTEGGWSNAKAVADGAPIIATVDVLHCFLPDKYLSTGWPWITAQSHVLSGSHAMNTNGEPSVRWRDTSMDPLSWKYHVDPRRTKADDYAALIVEWVSAYGADGLLLDYITESPWTYPSDAPVDFDENTTYLWRGYQILLTYQLRKALGPDFLIVANGQWPMVEPRLTQPQLLSGTFWERCGTIWWTPEEWLGMIRDRAGVQIYGGRQRGAKAGDWDLYQVSKAAAILEEQAFIEYRR